MSFSWYSFINYEIKFNQSHCQKHFDTVIINLIIAKIE